ncbi:hypothetical protein PPL_00522 [Heterostelium album PN500]|uniref:AIG1-type G domain-containing protein n=1 Tax=Heterostelium pallidum (strain ATCC 26659 / Pp 5 / PN500) TaxID=670386 RepID=D3AWP4_HETP5|nr:hypothetical protein PPL_00522 [Heterostelium album PN500]EFA86717.1 hypothetical protein PPL_00522 [Heterostelium album PN500]|eukprot:XP_020438821.1 hypothetical protein PPL_00522 [Heterostelium album PN500]
MSKNINIILFGQTGSGKSTLGNVILNKMIFKENPYGTSETKVHQIGTCVESDMTIKVIDTIGLDDTNLSIKEVLRFLANAALELMGGINIVIFIVKDRMTIPIMDQFKIIYSFLFKKEILAYTTIVRTRFESFQDSHERSNDIRAIKSIDTDGLTKYYSILHVDNASVRIDPAQIGRRIMSRGDSYMMEEERLEKERLAAFELGKGREQEILEQEERNRIERKRLEAARLEQERMARELKLKQDQLAILNKDVTINCKNCNRTMIRGQGSNLNINCGISNTHLSCCCGHIRVFSDQDRNLVRSWISIS